MEITLFMLLVTMETHNTGIIPSLYYLSECSIIQLINMEINSCNRGKVDKNEILSKVLRGNMPTIRELQRQMERL